MKERLKEKIDKIRNLSFAFEQAIWLLDSKEMTLREALGFLIKEGANPFEYGLMFDFWAPTHCSHTEGEEAICDECLNPILNRWSDFHRALSDVAIDLILWWEDETGEKFREE